MNSGANATMRTVAWQVWQQPTLYWLASGFGARRGKSGRQDLNLRPPDPQSGVLNQAELLPVKRYLSRSISDRQRSVGIRPKSRHCSVEMMLPPVFTFAKLKPV